MTLRDAAGHTTVLSTMTYDGELNQIVPAPWQPLPAGKVYTATVTTGVKDLAGNPLAADYAWTFRTAAGLRWRCICR